MNQTQDQPAAQAKDKLQDLDAEIKDKQDHLRELKTSIQARELLLTKLRELGERSKQDTAEYYFRQLNRLNDELGLKDKQLGIHLDRIKDLERSLTVFRAQAAESKQLTLQLRVDAPHPRAKTKKSKWSAKISRLRRDSSHRKQKKQTSGS